MMEMTYENGRRTLLANLCERAPGHFVRSGAPSLLICKCANLHRVEVPQRFVRCTLDASPSKVQWLRQVCPCGLITDLSQQCERPAGGEWQNEGSH